MTIVTAEDVLALCIQANPMGEPPHSICDPNVCGLNGLPCPRCMKKDYDDFLTYVTNRQQQELQAQIADPQSQADQSQGNAQQVLARFLRNWQEDCFIIRLRYGNAEPCKK